MTDLSRDVPPVRVYARHRRIFSGFVFFAFAPPNATTAVADTSGPTRPTRPFETPKYVPRCCRTGKFNGSTAFGKRSSIHTRRHPPSSAHRKRFDIFRPLTNRDRLYISDNGLHISYSIPNDHRPFVSILRSSSVYFVRLIAKFPWRSFGPPDYIANLYSACINACPTAFRRCRSFPVDCPQVLYDCFSSSSSANHLHTRPTSNFRRF